MMLSFRLGLAAVALCALPAVAAEQNTPALGTNGWYSDDTRADGAGAFPANTNLISPTLTDAPENAGGNQNAGHDTDILSQIVFGTAPGTVPSGTFAGAVHLSIGNNGSGKSQISHRKDDATGHGPGSSFGSGFWMEYSWMGDGTPTVTASVKFGIRTSEFGATGISGRTGENVWDKVLIYEPGNLNGGLSNGSWQTETVDWSTGKWWFFDRTAGAGTIGTPMTLSDMSTSGVVVSGPKTVADVYALITGPGAVVTSVQFGIGSGNANGSVYVNQLATNFYRSGDVTTFGFGPPVLTLSAPPCSTTGTVVVDVAMSNVQDLIVGGQFFLEYDTTKLAFGSAVPGDDPFTEQVAEVVDTMAGTIDYAVGVPFFDPGTMDDTVMARFTFTALGDICTPLSDLVTFRSHVPPTRLTTITATSIEPALVDVGPIAVDTAAPTITYCPPAVALECVEDADPGVAYATATGGVGVHYNDNGMGENPANQAYLKAQYGYGTTNGAALAYSAAPLTGIPFSWSDLYGDVGQHGFDMVIPAPSWDGVTPIPVLMAYENTNNSLGGAMAAGPVSWAFNGYGDGAPFGPGNPANGIMNSIVRSVSPPGVGDVVITRNDLSLSGTVYTAHIAGHLASDGFHHWYTVGTPDSPLANFNLNGLFYFDAVLTYDSAGDDGLDLVDFYEGTVTITANFPSAATGIPLAIDNCTLFPALSYVDVDNGGSGDKGNPLVITRTWTFADDCGNTSDCVQTITVEDVTAPTWLSFPDDLTGPADAGGCTKAWSLAEIGAPTATDNCNPYPAITWTRSDGAPNLDDPFPTGTTTITWFADDGRGNVASSPQLVHVDAESFFDVTIVLDGFVDPDPFDRCITFEFAGPGCTGTTWSTVMTFTNGVATGPLLVPCGDWTCVTARDTLHSLKRTPSMGLGISGTSYVADFSGADALVLGNFNDDAYIDILDFGYFVGLYGTIYGSVDTDCATAAPHVDLTGNGSVGTEDFTFIQVNFFDAADAGCCPAFAGGEGRAARRARDLGATAGDGPIRRISVADLRHRGLARLAVADLTGDGWLDVDDLLAFMGGQRP